MKLFITLFIAVSLLALVNCRPVDENDTEITGILYNQGIYSHWKLEEATGDLVDSINNITLTENGTIGQATGKFGNCRGGVFSASDYFSYTGTGTPYDGAVRLVEFWFNTGSTAHMHLIEKCTGGGSDTGWNINIDNGILALTYGNGSGGPEWINTPAENNYADGNWHYVVAGNISEDNERIYVDGVLQTEGNIETCVDSPSDLLIGRFSHPNLYPYIGLIDDIAYWNGPPSTWVEVESIMEDRWNNGDGEEYAAGK